jgi:hypothetical protein
LSENLQEPTWLIDTVADDGELSHHDDAVFRKYVVVEALEVTNKKLMKWAKLQYDDYPIATMTIPIEGMATISIFNFFPPSDSVLSVLNPDVVDEDEGKISVIKLATISFPGSDSEEGFDTEPADTLSTSTASAAPLESDNIGDFDADPSPSPSPSWTIKDAPIGLRLLNAYCTAHRFGELQIKPEGKERVKIGVRCEKGSWSKRYGDVSGIHAYLPRHSVPAAAIHTGPEVLYGVAFSSLTVYSKSGKPACMLGGVTILPPGKQWLHYALSCIGSKEIRQDQDPSCKIVQTFLSGLKSLPIKREEELINAINYIFGEWLVESESD